MHSKTSSKINLLERVYDKNNKFTFYLRDGELLFKQRTGNLIPVHEIIKAYYQLFGHIEANFLDFIGSIDQLGNTTQSNSQIIGDYIILKFLLKHTVESVVSELKTERIKIFIENTPIIFMFYDILVSVFNTFKLNVTIQLLSDLFKFTKEDDESDQQDTLNLIIIKDIFTLRSINSILEFVENNNCYLISLFGNFEAVEADELKERLETLKNEGKLEISVSFSSSNLFGCGLNNDFSKFITMKNTEDLI